MGKFIDLTGQEFGRLKVIKRENGKWLCKCQCGNDKLITSTNVVKYKSCGCYKRKRINYNNINELGKKYHKLTIIGKEFTKLGKHKAIKCKCDCGKEKIVIYSHLINGHQKSCGCYKRIYLENQVFGRLKVVKLQGISDKRHLIWKCICECGNIKLCEGHLLRKGQIKSCGCLQRDNLLNMVYSESLRYIKCGNCGKKIETFKKDKKYCSLECKSIVQRNKNTIKRCIDPIYKEMLRKRSQEWRQKKINQDPEFKQRHNEYMKLRCRRKQILKLIDQRIKSFQM